MTLHGYRIRWRPGAAVGTIAGHWHFELDGSMIADYSSFELSLVLAVAGYDFTPAQIEQEFGHCMVPFPIHQART